MNNISTKTIGFVAVICVLLAIMFFGFTGYNQVQNFQVLQDIGGKMSVNTQGGYYVNYSLDKLVSL